MIRSQYLDKAKSDHRILCVAIGLQGTLVTKDAGLRIKGSQLGVEVEDYRGDTDSVSLVRKDTLPNHLLTLQMVHEHFVTPAPLPQPAI